MPKPSEFLSATQKDGTQLCAVEIYEATWKWLNDRGCSHLISPQMIERYAMASARWIQCEAATSEFGFLAKHPTTGAAIQSPYVAIADKYMTQTNRIWGLYDGIWRRISAGRCYGAASYRSERKLICMKK